MLVLGLCFPPASRVEAESQNETVGNQTSLLDPSHLLQRGEIVPGEALVKFKETASVERAIAAIGARRRASPASDLDAVFERYEIVEAAKLFPADERLKDRSGADSSPIEEEIITGLDRIMLLRSPRLKNSVEETRSLIAELQRQPEVEYAEPNLIMKTAQATPNDPYFSSSGAWEQNFKDLWGLHNVRAQEAWSVTRGEGIVVAVTDTGVDYTHEDIADNIWQNPGETGRDSAGRNKKTNGIDDDRNGYVDDWRGWDFVTPPFDDTPEDNDPMDDNGHGTHVTGIIGAVGDNGKGIVGVAPRSKIMALKGIGRNGSGAEADLVRAIRYAADNGARVINASWGGFDLFPPRTLVEVIDYAVDVRGAVFVAAAGNSNAIVDPMGIFASFYPAAFRNVITVAASNHTDAKAAFSNLGSKIDVTAPGGGDTDPDGKIKNPVASVLSLLSSQASISGIDPLIVGGKYLRLAGTSMASPHVAGTAALVRAAHPEYTPEQVRQALRLGSDDVGTNGFDVESGYGRVNAAKAIAVNIPLAPRITTLSETTTGQYRLNIRGAATGSNLSKWFLEVGHHAGAIHGAGTDLAYFREPQDWTSVASSTSQTNDEVLGFLDTGSMTDGLYSLRLTAQDQEGRRFEDRLQVLLRDGRLGPAKLLTAFVDDLGSRQNGAFEIPSRIAVEHRPGKFRLGSVALYRHLSAPKEVSRVDLFEGTNLIGTTASPDSLGFYAVEWNTGPIGALHELRLVLTMNDGSTLIEPVIVSVIPNAPPDFLLLRDPVSSSGRRPKNRGGVYVFPKAPQDIILEVDAEDREGRIERVEFLIDGKPVVGEEEREDPLPRFSIHRLKWKGVQAGTYTFTARAIDDSGGELKSEESGLRTALIIKVKSR
jgi:subtilisin family serine protease